MRLLTPLAAVAALAIAAPAFAQDAAPAPQAPAAAAPEAPPTPEEAAFEAKGEAFGQRIEAMVTEMQTAAAQSDKAKAKTDLDGIQARYQPEVDAFATEFETFVTAQTAASGQDASVQIAAVAQQIKTIPAQARAEAEAEANAPAAPAEAPAQPQ